ncbi:MAG: thymidine phosphorylase [Planctomycetaceae bacterium]
MPNHSPAHIIALKRDGEELTDDQIGFFIRGYAEDRIPDYQMAALAMAVLLRGMNDRETAALTLAMLNSGTRLTWPDDGIPRVDKHSTGGVGDKISIVLAPLLAACGVQVPMLSGRGLGATGGTLDKLEAIPGFRTDLSLDEITRRTQTVGCVITGTTKELAPADRKLYALRDVTGTVPSIPLITASIMSKKLAESLDALVLDVKFGSGAFMKTRDDAIALARSLAATGRRMNVRTTALLTDMNQPLGRMCGNAVEILESIDVLQGKGPADVRDLTLQLAAELLVSCGRCSSTDEGVAVAARNLDSGAAFEKYQQMVIAQGGNPNAGLQVAPAIDVAATESGVVASIDTEAIGMAIIAMNGGRQKLGDTIDHSTGIEMLVRIDDVVERGQPLARVFSPEASRHLNAVRAAFKLSDSAVAPALIAGRV